MDGDIDYSRFGRRQLEEALDRIDRERYPLNYQRLTRELSARMTEPEPAAAAMIGQPAVRKSGNPALSAATFDGLAVCAEPMTLAGTINKTAMLLALVLAGAGWVWRIYFASAQVADITPYLLAGSIGGFVVALVTIFRKTSAPYTAPLYAVLEGLAIGGISALYEARHPGIAIQAVGLTFGVLACMLAVYRLGWVQVTERFKLGVICATGAIAIVYLADMLLGLFGHPIGMIHDSGTWGIAFSVFVVVIAALNLALDFDFISQGVAQRSPRYMEWYSAFALVLTLVWLYLEILRLLARRR